MTPIELLAPARNLATAREAILHGADAVYIGAPRFGARASAGNSLEDIEELVKFAHIYGVKIYVTLNTILFDNELEDARQLVFQLYDIGVDALIVQDMALLEMDLPPIALHASTQMDNRTSDKVRWLHELGFEQAVLARELSIEEIHDIHRQVPEIPLEVFVHGATCVSYNGQCYASQYLFERSANRGECAQFCRLPFDLIDGDGRVVEDARTDRPVKGRHLLSLHDMNRSQDLEELLDAGAVSLKIEGRLKDEAYVKNVVAYYNRILDEIIRRRPNDYCRSSVGKSRVTFTPQLERTFNRGFQDYFLHGRTSNMVQQCSPKSIGQHVGHVKEVRRNCFTVSGTAVFANGDGLCFVDREGRLQGFRVNRVEGNCLYPLQMPQGLIPRTELYRNFDQAFTVELSHPTAQRRIPVKWHLSEYTAPNEGIVRGVCVKLYCSDDVFVEKTYTIDLSEARTPQKENIERQLSKLGDTPFECEVIDCSFTKDWFIPSSVLTTWRRELSVQLIDRRIELCGQKLHNRKKKKNRVPRTSPFEGKHLDFHANVSNHLSEHFYIMEGAKQVDKALEAGGHAAPQSALMTLKYCPRHELGLCGSPLTPLSLRSADGRVFPLRFDCRHCMVYVLKPE